MSSGAGRPPSSKRLAADRDRQHKSADAAPAQRSTRAPNVASTTEIENFTSFIPAARRRRLRAALADAQLRGSLGEALPDTDHRALTRRHQLGRRDPKPRPPGGPLERAVVRHLAGIRHEITAAGARPADLDAAE